VWGPRRNLDGRARWLPPTWQLLRRGGCDESSPDARERNGQLMHDQLGIETQDAIAEAAQCLIPAGIGLDPARVAKPIDLDRKARLGGQEINDEAADRDLTAEGNSQPATPDGRPESGLRSRGLEPHMTRAGREEQLAG
jgi:hypothetical protein